MTYTFVVAFVYGCCILVDTPVVEATCHHYLVGKILIVAVIDCRGLVVHTPVVADSHFCFLVYIVIVAAAI